MNLYEIEITFHKLYTWHMSRGTRFSPLPSHIDSLDQPLHSFTCLSASVPVGLEVGAIFIVSIGELEGRGFLVAVNLTDCSHRYAREIVQQHHN
jgi:hypothetical protein